MRSGPSSVNTVLPVLPLRWMTAASGLVPPGGEAQVMAELGPSAHSISAFLKAAVAALAPDRVHARLTYALFRLTGRCDG